MRIVTKIGTYAIIEAQPADDGDAAIYHVRSAQRETLEKLVQLAGLTSRILPPDSANEEFRILIGRNDLFHILSALAETIDYDTFEVPDGPR